MLMYLSILPELRHSRTALMCIKDPNAGGGWDPEFQQSNLFEGASFITMCSKSPRLVPCG